MPPRSLAILQKSSHLMLLSSPVPTTVTMASRTTWRAVPRLWLCSRKTRYIVYKNIWYQYKIIKTSSYSGWGLGVGGGGEVPPTATATATLSGLLYYTVECRLIAVHIPMTTSRAMSHRPASMGQSTDFTSTHPLQAPPNGPSRLKEVAGATTSRNASRGQRWNSAPRRAGLLPLVAAVSRGKRGWCFEKTAPKKKGFAFVALL